MSVKAYDAIIVGSGPNGLAAAITLAEAGRSVLLIEAKETLGGGVSSSSQLSLPGYVHDICSSIYPMAVASPFFRRLPLKNYDFEWIFPRAALAHPFDDGSAALMFPSIEETCANLGADQEAYRHFFSPYVVAADKIFDQVFSPLQLPKNPLLLARFGMSASRSAEAFCKSKFQTEKVCGLIAGIAAHSFLPLTEAPSAAIGLVLAIAGHAYGWPIVRGGAQKLTDALVSHFRSLGGEIEISRPVRNPRDLPNAKVILFDLTAKAFLKIARESLNSRITHQFETFQPGPGIFKIDWALREPIPWKAKDSALAGTVHLGGTMNEIADSEMQMSRGRISEKPFVLLAQPSLFDSTRAPKGHHTAWAYCHTPRGSDIDLTERIEAQVERFAPGFRDIILSRHTMTGSQLETHNPNCIGGDISGGLPNFRQLLFRPRMSFNPYKIPDTNWYLCSSSTPPGAGVHGMCGVLAARSALKALSRSEN